MTLSDLYRNGSEPVRTGFAFVDISHDMVAWAAYRGLLVSASSANSREGSEGFISLMIAKAVENPLWLRREEMLESVRRRVAPKAVSRMTGLFCFQSKGCAERALRWGRHFTVSNFTEVEIHTASPLTVVDANWIPPAEEAFRNPEWAEHYWSGQPCPSQEPIWETIVDGTLVMCGTDLRERARENIQERFPDSVPFAELGRIAAHLRSNLGTALPFIVREDGRPKITFLIDFKDAKDDDFIERFGEYLRSGKPVNRAWLNKPPLSETDWFRVPDLTRYERWLD